MTQLPETSQYDYEMWLQKIQRLTHNCAHAATMKYAEDLGDYVETIDTLLSFAPRARDDIRLRVTEELDGGS